MKLWVLAVDNLIIILNRYSRKIVINNLIQNGYKLNSETEHLENAIEWLVHAKDILEGNGVSGGYSLVRGWAPPYPETTGYIIPTFIEYAVLTSNESYLKKAIELGDWEIDIQFENGAVKGGMGIDGKPTVFNTGQVILGWIALFKQTNQDRFLDAAVRAANWLISIQNKDGTWTNHTYLEISHAYHSRVAWPLLEVYEQSGDLKYKRAATNNILYILSKVETNGWINEMAFIHGQDPLTHTIAYTLRGLQESSKFMDEKIKNRMLEVVEKAATKIMLTYELRKISPNAMPQYLSATFNKEWQSRSKYSCLTGNAQMAIVWMCLSPLKGWTKF